MSVKPRKIIHSEARNDIRKVIEFFDTQKQCGRWKFPLDKASELAAAATGKSISVIKAIRKESQAAGSSVLRSPKKKRRTGAVNEIVLDDFDRGVIRRTVHEVYTVDHKVPTLKLLLTKLREKINFTGGRETLRKQLLLLGFKYKKCHDKRKLLMERSDIVAWRSRYLRKLKENEQQGGQKKPVTYLDETYIHPSHSVGKCWQSEEEPGVYRSERSGQRHIIVHAGGSNGFIDNGLLIFKSKSKSGDYHDDMNHTNFMQWLERQLIPNLPPNGIVVMDNASYHSVQINKPPTQANRKEELRTWLESNGVSTTADMRKAELITFIKQMTVTRTYYVDQLLKQHGHTVLRLPPYHCELNPIEEIWSLMKHKVAIDNVQQRAINIEQLVQKACSEITAADWVKHCDHVKRVGEEMWQRDGLMDDTVETLMFTVNTGSSSEGSDEFTESDTDSD